jgi:hypothetical protein
METGDDNELFSITCDSITMADFLGKPVGSWLPGRRTRQSSSQEAINLKLLVNHGVSVSPSEPFVLDD